MAWVIGAIIAILVLVIAVLFMNRFYVKATRENSLVRTGAGGQKVIIDGGCFALPILHQTQRVTMRTIPIEVQLQGPYSLITKDKLRVDMEMEFHVRVDPSKEGVAAAAQALGNRSNRAEELQKLLGGKLIDAIRSVAATRTMDELHVARSDYVGDVATRVADNIEQNGLMLESASLSRLDQAPFTSLDENNAFNAVGMRRLAEVISENRKQRTQIETETDTAVRLSQLKAAQHKYEIEREQKQAEITARQKLEEISARVDAEIARTRAVSSQQAKEAELLSEKHLKQVEIARDLELRESELKALLKVEQAKIENAIALKKQGADEISADVHLEIARIDVVEAQENVQTHRDIAVAKRKHELELMQAKEAGRVDGERVKTQVDSLMATAKAEASATALKATAEKARLQAEAEGRSAVIQAENLLSPEMMGMKLEMHKLDTLPELATQMMKPVEKIDSIRINHIGGFGGSGGGGGGVGDDNSPFNKAMESVLGMAVQLPAMKKLGEEIGLDFDANLASRMSDAVSRSRAHEKTPTLKKSDKEVL